MSENRTTFVKSTLELIPIVWDWIISFICERERESKLIIKCRYNQPKVYVYVLKIHIHQSSIVQVEIYFYSIIYKPLINCSNCYNTWFAYGEIFNTLIFSFYLLVC